MLDGCGIETVLTPIRLPGPDGSRSMLDGCGIETIHDKLTPTVEQVVAIDARWLWDRDEASARCDPLGPLRRDRCSMAVGSRRERTFGGSLGVLVAIDARWL